MLISKAKLFINNVLRKSLDIEIKRAGKQTITVMSKSKKVWDVNVVDGYWIGGRFRVDNISAGYHGLLQQWWEYYNEGTICLLVSENNKVKGEFQVRYSDWQFVTLDLYDNKGEPVDITADLCGDFLTQVKTKFDLIVCQATLEHVYAPFSAMKNMFYLLNTNGVVVIHTHTPMFPYHPYPRDYLRYNLDWFEDIGLHLMALS